MKQLLISFILLFGYSSADAKPETLHELYEEKIHYHEKQGQDCYIAACEALCEIESERRFQEAMALWNNVLNQCPVKMPMSKKVDAIYHAFIDNRFDELPNWWSLKEKITWAIYHFELMEYFARRSIGKGYKP